MIFAYHFLCITLNKKQSGSYKGFHMISPTLPASVRLQMHEGIDSEKVLKALKHEMSNKNQVYLLPLHAGHHWTLMVLDLPQKSIRYYDSINGDMSEACLGLAEIMLGYLMQHDIIKEDTFQDHPGITRSNSVRQPLQSNMCGHYVLAFMEEEMCRSEYGPAATEHPSVAASAWHSRLAKLTQALQAEVEKAKIEIVSEHQKLEAQGEKLQKERMKQYELAKKRLSQGHELTALMEEAYQQIHEHRRILVCPTIASLMVAVFICGIFSIGSSKFFHRLGITGNQLHEVPSFRSCCHIFFRRIFLRGSCCFAWQAWHLATSTIVSRGRCGTWRHPPSFRVAGVLRRFGWQERRLATSTIVSRGRRGTWRIPPSFRVAGVALGNIHHRFAWQAWHLATPTIVSRGRCSTWQHPPSFRVARVALADIHHRFAWQLRHLATSTIASRGRCGTWQHPPSFRVAGAALGDTHRNFAWQVWHLATPTIVSRGRCSTWQHPPSFRVAGVALADVYIVSRGSCGTWQHPPSFRVAGAALGNIHHRFAWQVRHLATPTVISRGRCGSWSHPP